MRNSRRIDPCPPLAGPALCLALTVTAAAAPAGDLDRQKTTVSVTAVDAERLESAPLQDLASFVPTVTGVAPTPGKLVIRGGAGAGSVGEALTLLSRDGTVTRVAGGRLDDVLDPADIERVEVISGAAATALYGHAAAGGVVLVTARSGDRVQVDLATTLPQAEGAPIVRRSLTRFDLPEGSTAVFGGLFGMDDRVGADWRLDDASSIGPLFASAEFQRGATDACLLLHAPLGGGPLDAHLLEVDLDWLEGVRLDLAVPTMGQAGVLETGGWLEPGGVAGAVELVSGPGQERTADLDGLSVGVRPRLLGADTRFDLSLRYDDVAAWGRPLGTLPLNTTVSVPKDAALVFEFGPYATASSAYRSVLHLLPEALDRVPRAATYGIGGRHDLAAPRADGFAVRLGVDRLAQGLPSFDWLRTETGGSIMQRPLLSEDADVSGASLQLGVDVGLRDAHFGGRAPRYSFDLGRFDESTSARMPLVSAGGNGLGIEDPDGSGFFITPGFGDVQDVRFDARFDLTRFGFGYGETVDVGPRLSLDWNVGLRYETYDYEAGLAARTNGNTLDIRRDDEVSMWNLGPYAGLDLSKEIGCCRMFLGFGAMLGYADADATSTVNVAGFAPRARDLDKSGGTYSFDLSLGAEWELGPGALSVRGGFGTGNRFGSIEYQETDPARLDFSDESWSYVGLRYDLFAGGRRDRP